MLALGLIPLLLLALALWVSFDTEGGSIGMVPVLVHAISVPLLTMLCLLVMRSFYRWSFPAWYLGCGLLLGAFLVGWLLALAGRLGARVHRRQQKKDGT